MDLQDLFRRITEQQNKRGTSFADLTPGQKKAYASEAALALFVEVGELTSSWPFASWKTTPFDRDNVKREMIDILFFMNIIRECHGISIRELTDMFEWVLENNERRMQNGEHKEVTL